MSNKNYLPKGDNSNANFYPQLDHFDFICGQVIKENKILRFVVIVSCLAFFLSIGITLYAVSLPESVPVIVTMNDFGETQYVGPVSRKNFQNYSVPELAVQYQVKDFVELYFVLSTDLKVMQKNNSRIYHYLTTVTAQKLNRLIKEESLYEDFGSRTREVFFETEPLKLSDDTYQVDIQLTTRDLDGSVMKRKYLRFVITTKLLIPSDNDIKDNPLGIYITNFDYKEIEKNKE